MLDIKNNVSMTALMQAAMGGHTETAVMLIDKGADVNIKNNDGKTALKLAVDKGYKDTALLIGKNAEE